jgi:hypothetical protein
VIRDDHPVGRQCGPPAGVAAPTSKAPSSQARVELYIADDVSEIETVCSSDVSSFCVTQSPALSLVAQMRHRIPRGTREIGITFRGFRFPWLPSREVFPPTVDSYHMIANAVDLTSGAAVSVWDVGCGTGVVGANVAALADCRTVLLTDVDTAASRATQACLARLDLKVASCRHESFPPDRSATPQFDLLLSNPPYFGLPAQSGLPFSAGAGDGLGLTRALAFDGPTYAQVVLLTVSSVRLEEAEALFATAKALRGVRASAVTSWRVPLPSFYAGERSARGIYQRGPTQHFPLWHDVYLFRLSTSGDA